MSELALYPLVILREHGGFVSATCAGAADLAAFADDAEVALNDLALFLGQYLSELPPSAVPRFVLPETATPCAISVLVPRPGSWRAPRMRTPLALDALELVTERGGWMLVPALRHVVFTEADDAAARDPVLEREVLRMAAALDLDGAEYLDLLPAGSFSLVRPEVMLRSKQAATHGEAKRKAALELLASIGRRVWPSTTAVIGRDSSELAGLLLDERRPSGVLVGPPGVGKSELLRLALREHRAPMVLATSGAELVAGQSFLGQLEQRVANVMAAAEEVDAVLYFDDLDDL